VEVQRKDTGWRTIFI